MRAPHLVATAAVLALGTTGIVPTPLFTGEAQASGRTAPTKGRSSGKTRKPREKSKQASSAKISPSKKRGNSSKKRTRKAGGNTAKQGLPATAATPVLGPAPLKGILKNGKASRASITAVSGVPLATPPTTATSGPSRRASLDVNTSPRSPRTKSITKSSSGKRAANGRKKSTRTGRGRHAKTAVNATANASGAKVTFNGYSQVVTFDKNKPATRIEGGPNLETLNDVRPRPSTVSEVLPRLPLGTRGQGKFRRFIGKVILAVRYGVQI